MYFINPNYHINTALFYARKQSTIMAKGLDIEIVKENYRRLSDAELIRIATEDAFGLTSEAQQIVFEEIKRRKLDLNIINGIAAQNKEFTLEEIDSYTEIIRNLNCPDCGSTESRLNATLTSEVISIIFYTEYDKKLKVACPSCLDKANNKAIIKTLLIGWWSIPWGIIRSFQAIINNFRSKKTNHNIAANDFLRSFILNNVGSIEAFKTNREKLQEIISKE